ncbi:MAG: hypothetical protein ABL933_17305 [Methyloglobulus sp.]|nr:hypothetical protein [Methyloglobulus sp.]
MPDIIAKLKEMAFDGDTTAAKLLLDRSYPSIKPYSLPVTVDTGANLNDTAKNLITAATSGNLAPDVAAMLTNAITGLAKLTELEELSQRIARLEDKKCHRYNKSKPG